MAVLAFQKKAWNMSYILLNKSIELLPLLHQPLIFIHSK